MIIGKHKLKLTIIATLFCTVMVVAGCGKNPENTNESETNLQLQVSQTESKAEPQTESELQTVASESEIPKEPVITTITISAVGDVTLGIDWKSSYENSFIEMFDLKGASYFLQNVRDIFEDDDFTIVNLEGTLTTSEDRMEKSWNHKGDPEYIEVLSCSSVEAVTLGNNHIMDYGEQGITDTIETVNNAGISFGMSNEYGNYLGMYETKGIKIGFVSVNEHYEEEKCYDYLKEGYEKLREQGAQLMIACTHWGGDKTHEPEELQLAMGKQCIDWGYDVVLGCHPHVLQGIEIYKGKYIVHSMGNFCYGGNKNPPEKDSMIWRQTFIFLDGELSEQSDAYVIPCSLSSVQDRNDYCPIVLEGEEADSLFTRLNVFCKDFNTYVDNEGRIHSK